MIIRYDLNKNGYYDSNNCTVSIVFSHFDENTVGEAPAQNGDIPAYE